MPEAQCTSRLHAPAHSGGRGAHSPAGTEQRCGRQTGGGARRGGAAQISEAIEGLDPEGLCGTYWAGKGDRAAMAAGLPVDLPAAGNPPPAHSIHPIHLLSHLYLTCATVARSCGIRTRQQLKRLLGCTPATHATAAIELVDQKAAAQFERGASPPAAIQH